MANAYNRNHIPDEQLDPDDPFYSLLIEEPDLPRVCYRSQNTRWRYKSWQSHDEVFSFGEIDPKRLLQPGKFVEGIIAIQDLGSGDSEAVSMLKSAFPSLDLRFIHQHTVRLEVPRSPAQSPEYHIEQISPQIEDIQAHHGLHFDGRCSPAGLSIVYDVSGDVAPMILSFGHRPSALYRIRSSRIQMSVKAFDGGSNMAMSFADSLLMPASHKYRTEVFTEHGGKRHRAKLLLTDAPLSIPDVDIRDTPKGSVLLALPKDPYDRPEWRGFDPYGTLLRTFHDFSPLAVLDFMAARRPPPVRRNAILHCLLAVSDWQLFVDELERELRSLQLRTTGSPDRSMLSDMNAYRRVLAGARETIANDEAQILRATGRATLVTAAKQNPRTTHGVQSVFQVATTIDPADEAVSEARAINLTNLLDKLAQLEDRLGTIAKTLNEEIQLFLASVSIRDSEVMLEDSGIMREDSQIMKQQAARTTLLTTLAVIYLPLQLITGIFGMNIREITGDGRPRWWACLAALSVTVVMTFLIYLAFRWWWQWKDSQRKERDKQKEKEA